MFSWLTDNPEIIRLGTIILFIDVILEVGRAINIYATNALRATGDVNLSVLCRICCSVERCRRLWFLVRYSLGMGTGRYVVCICAG